MLGYLVNRALLFAIITIMTKSNNATRADNQQERLIKIGWITGFVDGEGCFTIHFVKQHDHQEPTRIRRGYTTGYLKLRTTLRLCKVQEVWIVWYSLFE